MVGLRALNNENKAVNGLATRDGEDGRGSWIYEIGGGFLGLQPNKPAGIR